MYLIYSANEITKKPPWRAVLCDKFDEKMSYFFRRAAFFAVFLTARFAVFFAVFLAALRTVFFAVFFFAGML